MEKIWNEVSLWIGVAGGFAAWLLGGWDGLLITLTVLVVLDYISGVIKAVYLKTLSSAVGFKGILKKAAIFIVVAAASAAQTAIGQDLPLREMVMMFFIANEGISILENVAEMGMPIPEHFRDILLKLRNHQEEERNDGHTGN